MLITLERAKQQLVIDDDLDNDKISALITQAIGLVIADIGRDIYQTASEVPDNAEAPIILDTLKEYHLRNLETAVLLQLGSLWQTTEADSHKVSNATLAYKTAIKPFIGVFVG
jgi:hypothetical protein